MDRDLGCLLDILVSIRFVESYVEKVTWEMFLHNTQCYVLRNSRDIVP
ncbi:MAG: hypothetical protein BECKG1743D_GA0114223_111933 [Candidatus Kentron sp. G]|nr:MAG: hypothetical protein BECKG1743E_GA0114224_105901 [Candidatus Kentron sp. G]VFN06725.1 MAG: hypothetical protein BECKG1743F_GA0114225_112803 [Candidatus Kentron sp. G]VFN07920.1 MAG: hypothetical protein BECKG1743D_GA0114223_111933 [Candidatus Kentron sp. G]